MLRSLLLSGFALVSATISDCSQGKGKFQLTDLGLSPANPAPGDKVDMTVKFTNPGPEVNAGTVTTSVTYNFIPFEPTKEDLCINTQCPLVVGDNDRSTSSTWPDVSGLINTHIEWTDPSGSLLLCLDVDVTTAGSLRGSHQNKTLTVNDLFAIHDVFHNNPYHLLDDLYYLEWAEENERGDVQTITVRNTTMNASTFNQLVVWRNYSDLLNAHESESF